MANFLRFGAGLLLLFLGACQPAPEFHLLDGTPKRLADYEGRWLVLNFWAEWCAPCRKELPELASFARQHAGRADVLAVSYDPLSATELAAVVKRLDIRVPVMATEPVPHLPIGLPSALPATWLVAPDGTFHGPLMGEQTAASLQKHIQAIDAGFAGN